jgi:hypothetical protein
MNQEGFSLTAGEDFFIEERDEEILIRFDGDTLGFSSTDDGFSITNDWNDRHFTLAFGEESIIYHITRESSGDNQSGKNNLGFPEFVAEMYAYLRSLGDLVRVDELEIEAVGKVDVGETKTYLEERAVVQEKSSGIQFSSEGMESWMQTLVEDGSERGSVLQRILEYRSVKEASESGEFVFVYPSEDDTLILVFYPDGLVGVMSIMDILQFDENASGSQIMDHVIRSLSPSD